MLTVDPRGETRNAPIVSVFVTDNKLLRLELESGSLVTPDKQPLCRGNGQVQPAGELAAGDEVLRWKHGAVHAEQVLRVDPAHGAARVFNLVLGDSQLFVAGGVLARSKPPATVSAPPRRRSCRPRNRSKSLRGCRRRRGWI